MSEQTVERTKYPFSVSVCMPAYNEEANLPGMSGLDALRILKADPVTAAIPVIAVSAAAMPRDIQSGLDAGFRDYLTKPFDVQALLSRIREILQDSRR